MRDRSWANYQGVIAGVGVISLLLNFYLGYRQLAYHSKADPLALESLRAELAPNIQQSHLIVSGEDYRALQEIDWKVRIFSGEPVGTVVDTSLARDFNDRVATADALQLENYSATFIYLENKGSLQAGEAELVLADGGKIELGNMPSNRPLYVLTEFEIAQPYEVFQLGEVEQLKFEAVVAGENETFVLPYVAPGQSSWVPSLDRTRGLGSALVGEEKSYLLDESDD